LLKKNIVIQVLIATLACLALFISGSGSGMIHPSCHACAGMLLPLMFAFACLCVSLRICSLTAALILNGSVLSVRLMPCREWCFLKKPSQADWPSKAGIDKGNDVSQFFETGERL